jgi:hypothetical protein
MSDALTPEERAAIAAFPPDRIQRIPRGQTAEFGMRWDARNNRITGSDLPRQRWSKAAWLARKRGNEAANRKRMEEVAERRRKVRALTDEGLSRGEIAKALRCSVAVVEKDRTLIKRDTA